MVITIGNKGLSINNISREEVAEMEQQPIQTMEEAEQRQIQVRRIMEQMKQMLKHQEERELEQGFEMKKTKEE